MSLFHTLCLASRAWWRGAQARWDASGRDRRQEVDGLACRVGWIARVRIRWAPGFGLRRRYGRFIEGTWPGWRHRLAGLLGAPPAAIPLNRWHAGRRSLWPLMLAADAAVITLALTGLLGVHQAALAGTPAAAGFTQRPAAALREPGLGPSPSASLSSAPLALVPVRDGDPDAARSAPGRTAIGSGEAAAPVAGRPSDAPLPPSENLPRPDPPIPTPTPVPAVDASWTPGLAGAPGWVGPGECALSEQQGPRGSGSAIWPAGDRWLSGYDFSGWHPGIDISAAYGAPIYAIDAGVVVYAGWNNQGYGNLIILDHANGVWSAYAHLSQLLVGCVQGVTQGQVIAAAGSTGNSTAAHLHFETFRIGAGQISPWSVLPQP